MGAEPQRGVGPLLTVAVVFGLLVGLGLYTFVYAQGASYLTNDPAACVNCHVMNEQYNGWLKSSHHTVAVCNDCHAPHDIFAFTSGRFPDNIQITPRNHRITEAACRSCHSDMVHAIDVSGRADREAISCVRCHGTVGHGPR